jgi:hypothetical protein
MLIELKVNTDSQKDIDTALQVLSNLSSVNKPIEKKIEEKANETGLNPAILAQGVIAALTPPTPEQVVTESLATPAPTVSTETDIHGLPWDARIHAETKAKVKDGSWRYKRGLDDATKQTVETELKGAFGEPVPTSTPVVERQLTPIPEPTPIVSERAPTPPVPVPTPEPVAPLAPAMGFPEFMNEVTSTGLAEEEITLACQKFGVDGVFALAARPDLIAPVYNELFS